jgi:prephenate dehydrogenase
MTLSRIRIVGSGLIGTSIGLAAVAQGITVDMVDVDPRAQSLARDLVKSKTGEEIDLVLFAIPLGALGTVLNSEFALNTKAAFIDVASVKTKVKVEVLASNIPSARFLPSHPMAGREVGGAESARADLFQGRPWVIDSQGVDLDVVEVGKELIDLLGAHVIDLPVGEHDQAVALVSHLPQLMASMLAKQLLGAHELWLDLAGAGLRDTTRIAASDPQLWQEIIASNHLALHPLLQNLRADLDHVIASLEDQEQIAKLIDQGRAGRALIPGKHGGKARDYRHLPIVIEDKPGQLAALFDECANAKVNVEDLSIEHSPEQFTGLITLALSEKDAEILSEHLLKNGWNVHPARN